MWISVEPLCKHVCLCAHCKCNEYIITGRDFISPLDLAEDVVECIFWVL